MEIEKTLYAEIKAYCELNGLKTREFIHDILKRAFMEEKYGISPFQRKIEQSVEAEQKEEEAIIEKYEKENNVEFVPVDTSEIIFDDNTESSENVEKEEPKPTISEIEEDKPKKIIRRISSR